MPMPMPTPKYTSHGAAECIAPLAKAISHPTSSDIDNECQQELRRKAMIESLHRATPALQNIGKLQQSMPRIDRYAPAPMD